MAFRKKSRENLYYLFPVSRHGSKKRYLRNLKWALAVGLLFSALLALLIYLFNQI